MTEWTIDTLKEHYDAILDERDKAIKLALTHVDELEARLEGIKSDHVQRKEFSELKDLQNQGRGMRIAAAAFIGIIIALISVALGAMYANQLTTHDVSNQIDREAPWIRDKPLVESRLNKLETKVILLQTQLATHEATDTLRYKSSVNKGK